MEKEICENCKFWEQDKNCDDWCGSHYAWPFVYRTDWCGEFKKK